MNVQSVIQRYVFFVASRYYNIIKGTFSETVVSVCKYVDDSGITEGEEVPE